MRSQKAASPTAARLGEFRLRVPALSLGHIWIVCVLGLILGYVCTPTSFALDLWQHLTLGREMVRTHHLIAADHYAHTLAGQDVFNQNWLAEIILYAVASVGGRDAVICFVAALYALAFAALMYLCWTRCRHTRIAVGCTLLAAAIACENLSVRTQVFSAVCLSLELTVLWAPVFHRWRPLLVAAIVLLWTNTHGAFALGVALPVLFSLSRAVMTWHGREGRKGMAALLVDRDLHGFVLAAVLASAAMFCNPHPTRTIAYVFENVGAGVRRNIQEWQPVPFASITGKFFFGSLALLPLVLGRSRKRVQLREALLLVAFICLGAKAWRMAMWWGFALAPVLARHLATLLPAEAPAGGSTPQPPQWAPNGTLERPPFFTVRRLPRRPGLSVRKETVLNSVFLVILLTMTGLSLPWFKAFNPLLPTARRASVPPDEPQALATFLQDRAATGHAFNPMEWGGYLMWHFDGQLKVFVDGRIDPFSDAVWADYEAIGAGRADWDELLQRYGVTTLIADRRKMTGLVRFASESPRWKQVYADPLAVVFETQP